MTTSTFMIGSSRIGWALRAASRKRQGAGQLEGHRGRVDVVVAAVDSVTLTSTSGKPATTPRSHDSRTPFSMAGMNSRGITPPTIVVLELEALAALVRLDAQLRRGRTARARRSAGCACTPASTGWVMVSRIGHLRLADVGLDLELAVHAIDDDLEVELAHPADDASARSPRSVWTRKVGILDRPAAASAMPIRSWSALVLGSIACEITGVANCIRSSRIGAFSSHSVSPVVVTRRPDRRGDVARRRSPDVLALVGVHPQEPPDPLPLALGRVVDGRPRLERCPSRRGRR